MKGLEFKIVFLTGTDALSLPYKFQSYSHLDAEEKEAYHKQERALLYVAMTRAIQVLHLTGLGEASELVKV
jgi:superfamily I DNA/RNA helicase